MSSIMPCTFLISNMNLKSNLENLLLCLVDFNFHSSLLFRFGLLTNVVLTFLLL